MAVEIRILGPVGVAVDDPNAEQPAPGPAQRRLLALLAVHAGRVVSSERLADELGLASVGGVRTTVSRIRQLVGDVVRSEPPGYVVSPEAVDAARFLELLTVARSTQGKTAIDRYDDALAIWRGPALVEFAGEEWAQAEAVRLDELHATAREERIDALIGAGLAEDAAAEVERLIGDQPLRERPRGQLMTALTMQGRAVEALRSFQEFRSYLADEVGVEPSAELVALESMIVQGELLTGSPLPQDQRPVGAAEPHATGTRTLTFLFTDIAGSTARWESDAEAMSRELQRHDDVLRTVVEQHGGLVFKHTGDGICASFGSANTAIAAAIDAQVRLELPIRMGIGSGEAEARDGDYFGAALNRTARVMSAGHGGQILVAASAAGLVDDVGLLDLGLHRLRDIPGSVRLFQVVAEGLESDFEPLRTLDLRIGNLEAPLVGVIGRSAEVGHLRSLIAEHRLVTLTGVGGVGKTTLALHAANEMRGQFPDGVWVVELVPVSDGQRIVDALAASLDVTPGPGEQALDSVVGALSGRRALIVVDNCEHLLDAAAEMVEQLLARTWTINVLATSREGLGVAGEYLMPVPTLAVDDGAESAAVQLFLERARAVAPEQTLTSEEDIAAVVETCRRLDGIALAIELAAARMVSMTITDLNERLDDRFRLLASRDRRVSHHQTLQAAVAWSYDLLDDRERMLLDLAAVFADGFDLNAAAHMVAAEPIDEYEVLDLLDSLLRKSLINVDRTGGSMRYGMLETIRQFGVDRLVANARLDEARDLHAAHFATRVAEQWDTANTARQRRALEWLDTELSNLRTAFRWATDIGDLDTATTIAAHATMIGLAMQRFEPVGWVEEIVDVAIEAELPQLPRLLVAGGAMSMTGKPERALELLAAADELEGRADMTAFEPGWIGFWRGIAHRYRGRSDLYVENSMRLVAQEGLAQLVGLVCRLAVPTGFADADELHDAGERAMTAAEWRGIPYFVAFARAAYGRALAPIDADKAMRLTNEALEYAHEHRLAYFEAAVSRDAAALEVAHGDLHRALDLFETALAAFHRDGNHGSVATTFGSLASVFDQLERHEVAATIRGANSGLCESLGIALDDAGGHLREVLGPERFAELHAAGAAMEIGEAIRYAQGNVRAAHELVAAPSSAMAAPRQ